MMIIMEVTFVGDAQSFLVTDYPCNPEGLREMGIDVQSVIESGADSVIVGDGYVEVDLLDWDGWSLLSLSEVIGRVVRLLTDATRERNEAIQALREVIESTTGKSQ
jgi:hypothetical protein